jgi:Tfp pilus assembly protein FimV
MFDDSPLDEGPDYDPIGEAKIHMAYGNRQKALSILTKAAAEHPEREDIQRKLAELKELGS